MRYAAQQGRPFGGPPRYGFMRRDKTYEPDPEHAWVIRLIFCRYREGVSQFTIAQELAMRGIPTPRGKHTWKAGKIGRLLDNPAYAPPRRFGNLPPAYASAPL